MPSYTALLQNEARGLAHIPEKWPDLASAVYRLKGMMSTAAWLDFCLSIGIGKRHAYYLCELQEKAEQHRLTLPTDLSWRTLGEVAALLDWRNAESLFSFCKSHTREEVIMAIREKKIP